MITQLSRILSPARCLAKVSADSRKRVLENVSRVCAAELNDVAPMNIFDLFIARERLGSTAMGHGVAIPHVRFVDIEQPMAVLLQLTKPIAYEARDGFPVDLFFALLDKQGNLIAEDVIYTSGFQSDAVFAMHRSDTMLYIGGFVGDSVIIEGVDTFVTRGANDAFLAAYNIGKVFTSLNEPSGYLKASNGILAYPNPTQGQVTLMGKAVNKEAQLFNLSGQQVRTYRLDQNAFQQPISLENLKNGVYFLIIIGEDEKQQLKIVKQ